MFVCVNDGEYELVIKKSRFIAISRRIADRSEAKAFVDKLRESYPDATHVCSAFIADEAGLDFGYDDDGEPSGTAGKPIYAAIEASGAKKSAVAVVRYFGGIKLGAGGLTRAYRQAAGELIEKVGLVKTERHGVYSVECDGEVYKKILPLLRKKLCKTEQILYNERVSFTAITTEPLTALLEPFGVTPTLIGERYIPITD